MTAMRAEQRKARVRKVIKARRISQNELARQIGIAPAYLSQILSCHRRPSLPLAFKLEAATGIPAQEFIEAA